MTFSTKLYNPKLTKCLNIFLIIATYALMVVRFLLNEKGRVNPDSIRYMRQAHMLPVIDNTTAPLGYPFGIWLFTNLGLDEFWSSKVVGLLAYTAMLIFAWKKDFYFKEILMISALFSFVSVFSYTMSEAPILPFVFLLFYYSKQVIEENLKGLKAILTLSLLLIICYNIRYSALFLMAGLGWFGLLKIKTTYYNFFILSALFGVLFVVFFKFLYVDYFNEDYVKDFLNIGLKPTSTLLTELWQGLATTYDPFVHIADPSGGIVNYAIYGIGLINIGVILYFVIKTKHSDFDLLLLWTGCVGIACSYFVQYFYSVNPIDYRLLAPFSLPIWMYYFRRLWTIFGNLTYLIPVGSLITGFVFTWLSKGNYLENREEIQTFLKSENKETGTIKFWLKSEEDLGNVRSAEIISTVNPMIYTTFSAKDTLDPKVLTPYRVDSKLKIKRNQFQKFDKK